MSARLQPAPSTKLTLSAISALRKIAPRSLRSAIERGRLPFTRLGRDYFVELRAVDAYLASKYRGAHRPGRKPAAAKAKP